MTCVTLQQATTYCLAHGKRLPSEGEWTHAASRGMTHLGGYEFVPIGGEHVRVRFNESAGGITLTVHDPDVVLTAKKST